MQQFIPLRDEEKVGKKTQKTTTCVAAPRFSGTGLEILWMQQAQLLAACGASHSLCA